MTDGTEFHHRHNKWRIAHPDEISIPRAMRSSRLRIDGFLLSLRALHCPEQVGEVFE
jgi:hypothetical protein